MITVGIILFIAFLAFLWRLGGVILRWCLFLTLLLASPAYACEGLGSDGNIGCPSTSGRIITSEIDNPAWDTHWDCSGYPCYPFPKSSAEPLFNMTCNGFPCQAVHIPYEADQPVTIKCNGTDDRANWQMAQDIALKYHIRVKIGPDCHIKPTGKLAGMISSSIVIDGTTPIGKRYECGEEEGAGLPKCPPFLNLTTTAKPRQSPGRPEGHDGDQFIWDGGEALPE